MALSEKSTAYDISIFEEQKRIDRKKDNILKLPSKSKKANKNIVTTLFTVLTLSLGVVIFGTMLFNQVQLTEITDKTNKLAKQLEESQSENTQLQMRVKEKFSPEKVTYHAKNDLFMEQTNPSQIEYFSLSSGDKAEIIQNK